jgi:hypothetical protein
MGLLKIINHPLNDEDGELPTSKTLLVAIVTAAMIGLMMPSTASGITNGFVGESPAQILADYPTCAMTERLNPRTRVRAREHHVGRLSSHVGPTNNGDVQVSLSQSWGIIRTVADHPTALASCLQDMDTLCGDDNSLQLLA